MKKMKCCLQRQRIIITVATKTNEAAQVSLCHK